MHKFVLAGVLLALTATTLGQNNFSFNCTKDTTIQCTTSCITLNTSIPDIYSSTNSYSVNQISALSCFRGYVNPADPGPSTNLKIDDRYSNPLDITFPFSFYGTTYSKLIASTNGIISFDVSKAGAFSHFGILRNGSSLSAITGVPEDLPSNLYDNALIMGPYHDLDPNISTSTQQIKYEVVGTAPYRKWIISYFNVPLYTTACLNLNTNTHQIVLYESLGIVEIFIYDKEICLNWNNGRAMIGMQNSTKSLAITAPGRRASSLPWGGKNFNESWRFVPASGQSLFKRVELYTLSGNFVSNGTVSNGSNNLLNVSFSNVCPPSTGGSYLVKSFYKNPNNSGAEIMGVDTINISRGDPIVANIISAACAGNSTGVITVISPFGALYEYSLDGVTWQPSNVFNVLPGTYTLRTRIIGSSCISTKTIIIDIESFTASILKKVTPCPGPVTGSIQIFPLHGSPEYKYSINNGSSFQSSNLFTDLTIGTYKILVIDANGCSYSTEVRIDSTNLANSSVTNTICGQPGTGTIKVTPGFGSAPYVYSINGGTFQSSDTFTGLTEGTYNITIKDSILCAYSFDADIKSDVVLNINPSITMPMCYGNKNAKLTLHPSLGKPPYLFALNNNPFQTDSTFKDLAAENYVVHIKDSSGCIKDSSLTIQQPNPVSGTTIVTPAATCFSRDGQITVKANGGVTPFSFSIDNGKTFQSSNVFNAPAGAFKIIIKDSNECKANISDTLQAVNDKIIIDSGPDKTICAGGSITLSVTSDRPLKKFIWSPSIGLSNATMPSPLASPSDTATYLVTAGNEVCEGTAKININVLHKPIANAGPDTTICNNTFAILKGSATNISGSVSYLWFPATDMQTPSLPTTIVYPKSGRKHTYRLQVTDNYGCNFKVYDDVIVTMNAALYAFAGNDTVAALGLPHQLFGSGGNQYLWSPANVLNNPSLQNPLAVLQNDTRFFLTVKDDLGCVGTSSVFIKVFKGPTYYVPNAFTPNGDGLNDVFNAMAPGIKQTNYFKVFDRWGKL
ncbi:MAG: gliding motility-associated C-terminal domain-containing protein, partial [Bacteroidota bacterium]|nr:gliding motility-associated C-terminal domain-containing protein [Bacteroidota bacterium]